MQTCKNGLEKCEQCRKHWEFLQEWVKICRFKKRNKMQHYFITLTTDEFNPIQLEKDRQRVIDKIKPLQYYCYYELTKQGRPHVHMLIYVRKYIRDL